MEVIAMTDTNTPKTEEVKKTQIEFDVKLFPDEIGARTYTDKRFPGGRIRIYLPVPTIDPELIEDADELTQRLYNKSVQDLIDAGIVQNAYGERDWANLCLRGETKSETTAAKILENIQKPDGLGPLDADIDIVSAKIRTFFEAAVYTEKKERTQDSTKIVAKKLKSAGITTLTDEEIASIIAARKAG